MDDLDVAILQSLPEEGAKLGKYLDDTRTANQLAKMLDDPYVNATMLGRRLGELRKQGLVITPARAGERERRASGWQRTKEGKKIVDGGS